MEVTEIGGQTILKISTSEIFERICIMIHVGEIATIKPSHRFLRLLENIKMFKDDRHNFLGKNIYDTLLLL